MKKRGFTLIELVVVIALIAILAVTLAPRLRDQIAKANDAKAIAALGALRTASEIHYAETNKTTLNTDGLSSPTDLSRLTSYVDSTVTALFDSGGFSVARLQIGGYKFGDTGAIATLETKIGELAALKNADDPDAVAIAEKEDEVILARIAVANAAVPAGSVKLSNEHTIPVIIEEDEVGLRFDTTVLDSGGIEVEGAVADSKGKAWINY